ncbi:MAG: hypothetical protein WBA41_22315 [Rivularia sp. (in: cyanobacteria)]
MSRPKKQDLEQLWEQYTEFKKPQISPSTYAVDYRKYRNHIANLPTKSLDDAVAIRDYLIANLTPNAAPAYFDKYKCLLQLGYEK